MISDAFSVEEGDVVFQSFPKQELTEMIEGATHSPYSHCGIVARADGEWKVIEAVGPVKETPLANWIARGRGKKVDVYRLDRAFGATIPAFLEAARQFMGRPYDMRYRMDDEAIYCSELVYKAFQKATGEKLGELSRLRDLDWQPYDKLIRQLEGGPPPLDLEMITPRDLAKAKQLSLVFESARNQ